MFRFLTGLFLSCLIFSSLQAQIGMADLGGSHIGNDSVSFSKAIGKATTPKCPLPGACENACAVYTFIGAGDWSIEGNWEGEAMPPASPAGCLQIVINPIGTQECLLNIPLQLIPAGASILVVTGKRFRVPGRLVHE